MPKASPPLRIPFGAVGTGKSVAWDRSYREPGPGNLTLERQEEAPDGRWPGYHCETGG